MVPVLAGHSRLYPRLQLASLGKLWGTCQYCTAGCGPGGVLRVVVVVCYSFFHGLCILWQGALATSWCVSCLVGRAVVVERMIITCGPAQVAVEYGVGTAGLFPASWCYAFMVKMVVGAATLPTLWNLVAGHAYISGVAKLEAVFAH